MKREFEQPIRRAEQQALRRVKFVGFDLDGTLLQQPLRSHPDVFGSSASHLFGLQKEESTAFAQSTQGTPTQQQLKRLHVLESTPNLRQLVADSIDTEFFNQPVETFPEVLDVLKQLKEQGIHTFISSSRPTTNIEKILLDHPQLSECIDFAIGTDPLDPSLKKGKEHFKVTAEHFGISCEEFVQHVVFIGDTPSDMQAGSSLGVRTIGRSGTKTHEELLAAGAMLVVDDFSSLPFLFNSERKFPSEKNYEEGR